MDPATSPSQSSNAVNFVTVFRSGSTNRTGFGAAVSRGALILALLSALVLAARSAQAQSMNVLYNFPQNSIDDGAGPIAALTPDAAGNLYTTTNLGGQYSNGSVVELSPDGGGWDATTLYNFTGRTDGSRPAYGPLIFDNSGNLYGVTNLGGAYGYGTVYELSPSGGGSWTEAVLYSFPNDPYNSYPTNGLIMDSAGNLYGTLYDWLDFKTQPGAVFELSPSNGSWTENVIYEFHPGNDAGLTMDAAGDIFGIGAINGLSDVFELTPNGQGGWTKHVIYVFPQTPENENIDGTLVLDQSGNLYGTTGGDLSSADGGTVYKLSPAADRQLWTYSVIYAFQSCAHCQNGYGGYEPFAGVTLDPFGNIYGTTSLGGAYGGGVVFMLVPSEGEIPPYREDVLVFFNGLNGSSPYGQLIRDSAGNLYGTTTQGGTMGAGNAFEVTP
jgi:uncharacterized repeat protein (TIGR03803 family)